MINNLGTNNSLLKQYIAKLRDIEIQRDSLRLRRNLERLREIFAYEIGKVLKWATLEVVTPLGTAQCDMPSDQPVIATVLRAGLPFHQGTLKFFDRVQNAFISANRKSYKSGRIDIQNESSSSPKLDGNFLIIGGPMLATGASMLLASVHEIDYLKRCLTSDHYTMWVRPIDDELTSRCILCQALVILVIWLLVVNFKLLKHVA